jgi:phage portal protein BeeE
MNFYNQQILINRALQKAGDRAAATRKRSVSNQYMNLRGGRQHRQGVLSLETLRRSAERSDVIFTCQKTLIEFCLSADWVIRPKDEDKAKWMEERDQEGHVRQKRRIAWLEGFFKKPNQWENYNLFHRKFIKDILTYDAGGYEVVWADFDNGRLPVELGIVPGDTVEIETDETGIPVRYWQSYNVLHPTEFETDELAYVSLNPSSWSVYGLSPIEVANIQIASDMAANQYNADVFSKNNIPPGILAVMGTSKEEFIRLMAQLRGVSADNPHNIHAMRAPRSEDGAKKLFEYVPLQNTTNREMQYKELLEQTVTRICMVYGVTPSQIGFTEGVTGGIGSGVAETQVDLTQNKGVAPLLQAIADCHNNKVIDPMGWGDLEFAYTQSGTPAQQKEREDDRADVQGGTMTQNEYRAKYGRESVDWGDLPVLAPQGWQPPMSPEQMQQQMMMQGMGGQPGQDPAQQMPQGMAKSVKRITVKL